MRRFLVLTIKPLSKTIVNKNRHNTVFMDLNGRISDLEYILDISHHVYENVYDTVIVEKELFGYLTDDMEEIAFLSKPKKYIVV